MRNDKKGFGAIEGLLILIIVGLIGFVGWYVWQSKNNADKNLNAANAVSEITPAKKKPAAAASTAQPLSKNGITITSPADNSTVPKTFTLKGTTFKKEEGTNLSVYIDNDVNYYWDPAFRGNPPTSTQPTPVANDGTFTIRMDLNGPQVIQTRGSRASQYLALNGGKHTFHVVYDGSLGIPKVDGPTITLTVQ